MIFNEDKLQAEIIKTWGEFGVHNEVFQAMRKKISDKEQLTLTDVSQQSELLTGFVRFERLQDYKYKLLPLSEKIEKYLASL